MKHDDFFVESVLHVIASENLNISEDLKSTSDRSIADLLNEEKEEPQEESKSTT
jgi:hypothetical protein